VPGTNGIGESNGEQLPMSRLCFADDLARISDMSDRGWTTWPLGAGPCPVLAAAVRPDHQGMVMDFASVQKSVHSRPPTRPTPLPRKPPNGVLESLTMGALNPTDPNRNSCANRRELLPVAPQT
jgi:hypothetical protein